MFRTVRRVVFLTPNVRYTFSVDALLMLKRGRDRLGPQRNARPYHDNYDPAPTYEGGFMEDTFARLVGAPRFKAWRRSVFDHDTFDMPSCQAGVAVPDHVRVSLSLAFQSLSQ
jgi:hypothetical protein